jgi:hypothetical protein
VRTEQTVQQDGGRVPEVGITYTLASDFLTGLYAGMKGQMSRERVLTQVTALKMDMKVTKRQAAAYMGWASSAVQYLAAGALPARGRFCAAQERTFHALTQTFSSPRQPPWGDADHSHITQTVGALCSKLQTQHHPSRQRRLGWAAVCSRDGLGITSIVVQDIMFRMGGTPGLLSGGRCAASWIGTATQGRQPISLERLWRGNRHVAAAPGRLRPLWVLTAARRAAIDKLLRCIRWLAVTGAKFQCLALNFHHRR